MDGCISVQNQYSCIYGILLNLLNLRGTHCNGGSFLCVFLKKFFLNLVYVEVMFGYINCDIRVINELAIIFVIA